MKRSGHISLVLLASVAATATLAGCEAEPAIPDNGGTFANKAECVAVYDEATCTAAERLAASEHASNAPKFSRREQCAAEYGADMCRPASDYGGASDVFVPAMMGYMLGSALSTPAPLYYGPGSYRDRERRGYQAPIFSSGSSYRGSGTIGSAPYVSRQQATRTTPGSLKNSTALTPPGSQRGGFGSTFKPSTSFKSNYQAQNPSSFGRSSISSGSSYKSSTSVSSRGGFGSSGRSFGSSGS